MEFTDKLLEKCAEAVHKAYCNYLLQNKGVEYWTKGNYNLLDEPTKQIDRETVKAVFETIKANPLDALVMPKIASLIDKMIDEENDYCIDEPDGNIKVIYKHGKHLLEILKEKITESNFSA